MTEDKAQIGRSLPDEINIATRSLHTTLNRLITSRLPFAIPPYAQNPTLYSIGLLHFSHIYLTFESLWADLSSPSNPPTSPLLSFLLVDPWDADADTAFPPSPQMLEFLRGLRPRGLSRSSRLKRDLEVLTGLKGTDLEVRLAQFPGVKVQEFCAHIRKVVKARPHVLVAYAWCFYMAVFSGGRWIRSELRRCGGEEFWRNGAEASEIEKAKPLDEAGLSLWYFDSANDGEDIKAEFKQRLSTAEDLFTPQEREDIIAEAKEIFKLSANLVHELDEKLATDFDNLAAIESAQRHHSREKKIAAEQSSLVVQVPSPRPWFRRPEVIGSAFAIGCVAWVAIAQLKF